MVQLLNKSFQIGSIKIDVEKPFTWVSGYKMPIYNDNRKLLFYPIARKMVAEKFDYIIKKYDLEFDVIAGTATAGIPHATSLADHLEMPLVYVRTNQKRHGLNKIIEGADSLKGRRVLLIEDLISTGKSSENALQIIREHGGMVTDCLSIFNYQFIDSLTDCRIHTIMSYNDLHRYLSENNVLTEKQIEEFKEWHKAPFEWGNKFS